MPEFGTNVVGTVGRPNYSVLAAAPGYLPTAEGVTIDTTTLTAEAAARTLPGGYVTSPGELVIPAGSILYALQTGVKNSKYGVAAAGTALVVGETYVLTRDWSYAWDLPQVGAVTASAEVILSRLQVGANGQPTLANVKAAMPTLRLKNV